jgi:hypothetical protein
MYAKDLEAEAQQPENLRTTKQAAELKATRK